MPPPAVSHSGRCHSLMSVTLVSVTLEGTWTSIQGPNLVASGVAFRHRSRERIQTLELKLTFPTTIPKPGNI
jgi:hypothetical protein